MLASRDVCIGPYLLGELVPEGFGRSHELLELRNVGSRRFGMSSGYVVEVEGTGGWLLRPQARPQPNDGATGGSHDGDAAHDRTHREEGVGMLLLLDQVVEDATGNPCPCESRCGLGLRVLHPVVDETNGLPGLSRLYGSTVRRTDNRWRAPPHH